MTDLVAENGYGVGYVIGSGTLTTGGPAYDDDGDIISDVYVIASFTGTLYGDAVNLAGSTAGYDVVDHGGQFIYDNETSNLPGNSYVFDSDSGVLFTVAGSQPLGGGLGNIWANDPLGTTYNYYVATPGGGYSVQDTDVTFNVTGGTPVPEPASLALLGSAFAGLALMRRRRLGPTAAAI